MAIHVDWDDPQKEILRWEFVGYWTLDELLQAAQHTTRLLLDDTSTTVDFIINVSQGGLIPPRLLPYLRKTQLRRHPREGIKIVVGADQYLRIFFQEFWRYAPAHWDIRFADTYEEARALIRSQRPSLLRS